MLFRSHAKPSITNDPNGGFDIQSYSHAFYPLRSWDKIDASDYYAATELGAKFKSREAIYKFFNLPWSGPQEEATC